MDSELLEPTSLLVPPSPRLLHWRLQSLISQFLLKILPRLLLPRLSSRLLLTLPLLMLLLRGRDVMLTRLLCCQLLPTLVSHTLVFHSPTTLSLLPQSWLLPMLWLTLQWSSQWR